MKRSKPLRAVAAVLASVAATVGLAVVASPASAHDGGHTSGDTLTWRQRTILYQATKQFRNPAAAEAAGYIRTDVCAADPNLGGMGYHYFDPAAIADPKVNPRRPDVLVYVPTKNGGRTLGALEWVGIDPDQDVTTDEGRPYLFGHAFDGPMLGHGPGEPVHFDLHVWLYKDNPAGMLTAFNPKVRCPAPPA